MRGESCPRVILMDMYMNTGNKDFYRNIPPVQNKKQFIKSWWSHKYLVPLQVKINFLQKYLIGGKEVIIRMKVQRYKCKNAFKPLLKFKYHEL